MLRGLLAGTIAWMAVVVAFLLYDALVARKERSALLSLGVPFIVRRSLEAVGHARTAFTVAVNRYEAAVALIESAVSSDSPVSAPSPTTAAAPAGGVTPPEEIGKARTTGIENIFAEEPKDLLQLEVDKGNAREKLMDAQRLWEAVDPGEGPDSRHDLWMGSGFMRGWQLGPIGYERAFVRLDHLTDPTSWAVWEIRRPRFGFGLGYERQRLALFCLRTASRQLTSLVGSAFDGVEVAFRPGISPTRTWRRLNRDPLARSATRELLKRHELGDLISGPDGAVRAVVRTAFEEELGESLETIEALPPGPGLLSIHTKGPSLSFGVWGGPRPTAELLGSSGHTSWDESA